MLNCLSELIFLVCCKKHALPKGVVEYIQNRSVPAVHWHDKRDVYAMVNMHSNRSTDITRRGGQQSEMKLDIILE